MRCYACQLFVFLLLSVSSSQLLVAEELHSQIDQLILAGAPDAEPFPVTNDEAFLRRIYLDLAGRIPTVTEAESFLKETDANKRTALVDQLLAGREYPLRMQELFNAMLMERRAENEHWTKFLRTSFEQNRPWNVIAQALLKPVTEDESKQGASFFLTSRLTKEGAMAPVDVPGLTRDVGRLLAGVDLQCAQCHDHISIKDYHQQDFQGLHMIFENIGTRRDVDFPAVSEKVLSEQKEFISVFTQIPMKTSPKVPGGAELSIPTFTKGEEYLVPPDNKKRTPGIPKFSPLDGLATGLASAENELFCKNIVNRLWFVMMGRGLVEPMDLMHTDNPPSHPELLDLLAKEFAAHKFDIKWFLRELALTDTYQRTSLLPAETDAPEASLFLLAKERRLSAEQLFWSVIVATGELDRQQSLKAEKLLKEKTPGEEILAVESFTAEDLVLESDQLKKIRGAFVKAFANPPKEPENEFEPTVKAAFFLMHDDQVLELIAPQPGNRVDVLSKNANTDELIQNLFLGVFTRSPTADEVKILKQHLDSNPKNRADLISQLTWAMLASTEFCVNH